MKCRLHLRYLERAYNLDFFGPFLQPFLAFHKCPLHGRPHLGPWPWTDAQAVRRCLDAAWDMLGKWQARRGVIVDPAAFRRAAPGPILALAAVLNSRRISCMTDLVKLPPEGRPPIVRAIHQAVVAVSAIKPTKVVQPVFGSKVLHHFFPSVVPVFDTAKVRDGVLRLPDFVAFLRTDNCTWLLWHDEIAAQGPRMLEFHRYFAFCLAQLHATPARRLASIRGKLARAWQAACPPPLAENKNSVLWKLDAKAAEFCLKGRAVAEGILT
ncbi:MAG: hypothetical protein HYZ53_08330 [Planctomycetes bacterium]|nr:hypothetical protein [Planctomycetota bacterium]